MKQIKSYDRVLYGTLLFFLMMTFSCVKEGPIGPQGPAGPTGPAGPAGPAGSTGSGTIFLTATGTGSLIADNSILNYTLIPGLSVNITVPSNTIYKALIQTDGGVQLNSSDPTASGFTDIAIFVNNVQIGSGRRVPVLNTTNLIYSVSSYSFSVQTSLTAGTYLVRVMAKKYSTIFSDCYVSSDANGSVLVGNPRLQGILNIILFP